MSDWYDSIVASVFAACAYLLLLGIRSILNLSGRGRISPAGRRKKIFPGLPEVFIMSGRNRRLFLLFILLFMIMLLYLWFKNILLALIISISFLLFIIDFFSGLDDRRRLLLHNQLIELINHMIIMLKAGKTLRFVFENAEDRFPKPLNTYLRSTAEELKAGNSLSCSLDVFSGECRSREVDLLTAALKINLEIGGDIIYILNNINESLIDGLKSKSRARTLSLQSRFSANIIAMFPLAILLLLSIFTGDSVVDFFSSPSGTFMLLAGGLLQVAGILTIKKIFRNIN